MSQMKTKEIQAVMPKQIMKHAADYDPKPMKAYRVEGWMLCCPRCGTGEIMQGDNMPESYTCICCGRHRPVKRGWRENKGV